MGVEIRIPEVGESVREALLAEWFKADGDAVRKDEALFLLETDKITLEVPADADGVLKILVPEGQTVSVGEVVGTISPGAGAEPRPAAAEEVRLGPEEPEQAVPVAAERERTEAAQEAAEPRRLDLVEAPEGKAAPEPEAPAEALPPSVRRLVAQHRVDLSQIAGTGPGGRITKGDVVLYLERSAPGPQPAAREKIESVASPPEGRPAAGPPEEHTTRKPMSPIRKRIAERLLEAKHSTAMLTTFNEIDMSRVVAFRSRYKEAFREKHGIRLGFMSFFVKAAVEALKAFPRVNAYIEGDDIAYHDYYHVGVAIGAERGLVVPVIRHVDRLSFAEIEQAIAEYVEKVNQNRLELSDLEGGTFTITNGGVFGSLLSTPILNYPQSGILGLHKIEDRPVVVEGQIVVRPMMYVALSYDHRIVDGREAVQFLVRLKEAIEDPERLLVGV